MGNPAHDDKNSQQAQKSNTAQPPELHETPSYSLVLIDLVAMNAKSTCCVLMNVLRNATNETGRYTCICCACVRSTVEECLAIKQVARGVLHEKLQDRRDAAHQIYHVILSGVVMEGIKISSLPSVTADRKGKFLVRSAGGGADFTTVMHVPSSAAQSSSSSRIKARD